MCKNRKITFLLGSGATKPWGGKTTNEITENIFNSVDSIVNNHKTSKSIILKIKQIIENYNIGGNYTPTFEDFLEIIEFLIIHYRNKTFDNPPKFKPFFPLVFDVIKDLDQIIEPNQVYNENDDENWKKSVTLSEAYEDILSCVFLDVIKYINIAKNCNPYNEKFYRFLKTLSNDNVLRIYNINYDDLVRNLAKDIYLFNGFQTEDIKTSYDLKKIITNLNIHCCYNLHGSFYFEESLRMPPESRLEVIFTPVPKVQAFSANAFRNKLGFSGYNVISGRQKFLKTDLHPYDAFFNSFIQDCIFSNTLIIIGYSFSDYHINNAINTFIQTDKRRKIIILTFFKNPEDEGNFQNTLHATFPYKKVNIECKIKSVYKSEDGDFIIYNNGFEKFLENEEYMNIMNW